jgi:hypothetical protein
LRRCQGLAIGNEPEEGSQRSQSAVAGADGSAALHLDIVQEREHFALGEIAEFQGAYWPIAAARNEAQVQPPCVAI